MTSSHYRGHRRGDMHPEDIKAAVRKRGWTLKSLALHYGLPAHACQQALREGNRFGELAIAETLGRSPREIWPSRFLPEGGRRSGIPPRFTPPETSPLKRVADSQKGDAA